MNIEELQKENDYLTERVEELETKIEDLTVMCDKFENFIKPCAIGQEQIWDVLVKKGLVSQNWDDSGDLREHI